MLRFDEFALFLVPFVLYGVWWVMGPRTPPWATWAALFAVLVLAGGAFWFGLAERSRGDEAYAPARIVNGQVVPGRDVPRPIP